MLYAGDDGFLEGTLPFVREGVEAGEPVLIAAAAPRIEQLRAELDGSAGLVRYADMAELGTNPARIIPVWQEFVAEYVREGRSARGVGEPVWAGRGSDELTECHRHEALLNLAFAEAPAWQLLCPYDTDALEDAVIDEALRSHPLVRGPDGYRPSDRYRGLERIATPPDDRLPAPPETARAIAFDLDTLAECTSAVFWHAHEIGIDVSRTNDLVLAANEILTNSVRHGGGRGTLRVWYDDRSVVCEIEDGGGGIADPLAGRRRPPEDEPDGRGLWMANQLCDLVQIRPTPSGNVVRLSIHR